MNEYMASLLMVGSLYGSIVFISPYLVNELGILSYILILFSYLTFNMFSFFLLNDVYVDVLSKQDKISSQIIREPLKFIASQIYGNGFGTFTISIQMLVNYLCSVAEMLLSATLFQSAIPSIQEISTINQIRIITVVLCVLVVLPSQRGTYKEFGVVTWITFGLVVVSQICLFISITIIHFYDVNENGVSKPIQEAEEGVASSLSRLLQYIGMISYMDGGMIILPNIAVTITNIKRLRFSIFTSTIALFFVYILAGIIPYVLLKQYHIEHSIVDTLARVTGELEIENNRTFYLLRILMVLCPAGIGLHLIFVVVITINPVFLYIEEKLDVPTSKKLFLNFTSILRSVGLSFIRINKTRIGSEILH